MRTSKVLTSILSLVSVNLWAQESVFPGRQVDQAPGKDGVYYAGPEVTAPRLVRTVYVPYPEGISGKEVQGMTVLAMVIDADGIPTQIQVLHTHGQIFDQVAIAAVKESKFEPGKLGEKSVPV
jgi:TonB family protein